MEPASVEPRSQFPAFAAPAPPGRSARRPGRPVNAYAQAAARIHAQLHIYVFLPAGRIANANHLAILAAWLRAAAGSPVEYRHAHAAAAGTAGSAALGKQWHTSIHHLSLPSTVSPAGKPGLLRSIISMPAAPCRFPRSPPVGPGMPFLKSAACGIIS